MNVNPKYLKLYTQSSGLKNILQTKPADFSKVNFNDLRFSPKAPLKHAIGQHKIPKFLYHFTTEEGYKSILKEGKVRVGGKGDPIKGIFLVELSNLLKRWTASSDWESSDLRKKVLKHVIRILNGKIVLLRIPTKNLDKEKILVRSQNRLFKIVAKDNFDDVYEEWKYTGIKPPGEFTHAFYADSAKKAKLYKQRKEAIEYIYPMPIEVSKIKKIGEIQASYNYIGKTPIKNLFSELLKGTPEEKALVLLKTE